jgi:hypothetical protein
MGLTAAASAGWQVLEAPDEVKKRVDDNRTQQSSSE